MKRVLERLETHALAVVLALTVAALGLRVVAVLAIGEPTLHGNESIAIARSLATGQGFAFDFYKTRAESPLFSFMPPLYPALAAFFLRASANPALGLELAQAALSAAMVPLLYAIAGKLSGRRLTGLLAATAIAFYPVSVLMVGSASNLTINTLLLAALVAGCLVVRERMSWMAAVMTGAIFGLLLLTRPALLMLLPLIVFWLWLNQRTTPGPVFKLSAVIAIVAFLIILPWLVRTARVHDRFVYIATNSGFNLWNGKNPFTTGSGHEVDRDRLATYLGQAIDPSLPATYELQPYPLPSAVQSQLATIDELALDRELRRAALAFIGQNPARWAELAVSKLVGFLWFRPNAGVKHEESWTRWYQLLYGALLLLAVPGLVLSARRWRVYCLLYAIIGVYGLTTVIFHIQTRHRWEVEPFLLVFAALTVTALADRFWPPHSRASYDLGKPSPHLEIKQ